MEPDLLKSGGRSQGSRKGRGGRERRREREGAGTTCSFWNIMITTSLHVFIFFVSLFFLTLLFFSAFDQTKNLLSTLKTQSSFWRGSTQMRPGGAVEMVKRSAHLLLCL
ncbi:hypothetical protein NL108_000865 [Boleophthalmus pectinirostris]|nr:hypothetical protein NL108_000865 [Boleophthalmus pectinirostris]